MKIKKITGARIERESADDEFGASGFDDEDSNLVHSSSHNKPSPLALSRFLSRSRGSLLVSIQACRQHVQSKLMCLFFLFSTILVLNYFSDSIC